MGNAIFIGHLKIIHYNHARHKKRYLLKMITYGGELVYGDGYINVTHENT